MIGSGKAWIINVLQYRKHALVVSLVIAVAFTALHYTTGPPPTKTATIRRKPTARDTFVFVNDVKRKVTSANVFCLLTQLLTNLFCRTTIAN
jgi:hypothetical protein